MPRDVNGNYSLPTGNPVAPDTVIESVWANDTMNDIKTEISNSLSRDGFGGMRAPFKNADGTMLNPGISWGNEPTSGWYRKTTNEFWYSVGNEDIFGISKTGVIVAPGKILVGVDIPPPFPSGTRMLFNQTTAPVGWTKVTSSLVNNNALRIVTGAVSSGGTDDFTNVFGSGKISAFFTLSMNELPSHAFSFNDYYQSTNQGSPLPTYQSEGWNFTGNAIAYGTLGETGANTPNGTNFQGGGQPHQHGIPFMNLKYQDVIIAIKD